MAFEALFVVMARFQCGVVREFLKSVEICDFRGGFCPTNICVPRDVRRRGIQICLQKKFVTTLESYHGIGISKKKAPSTIDRE